jgi:nucleotide-binding universal stress UspA family protein
MKTIIVPTDFSAQAKNAAYYAAEMAVEIDASLSLLHVYQPPMSFSEVPVPAEDINAMIKDAEEKIDRLKGELLSKTMGNIKIYAEVKTGTIVTEIEAFCKSVKPYAVIMGTQGTGAVERFFFGSNTLAAMRRLDWPLIVVPPGAKFAAITKVGLACDFRKVVETTPVEEIKSLIKDFHAELHVLHVSREAGDAFKPEVVEESGLLQEMLEEVHPQYHFIGKEDVDEALNEFAVKNKLDLLIVIPKSHNILDRLVHKSHSKQLALHSQVPIMSVHE